MVLLESDEGRFGKRTEEAGFVAGRAGTCGKYEVAVGIQVLLERFDIWASVSLFEGAREGPWSKGGWGGRSIGVVSRERDATVAFGTAGDFG
jgi:hypothetical protein